MEKVGLNSKTRSVLILIIYIFETEIPLILIKTYEEPIQADNLTVNQKGPSRKSRIFRKFPEVLCE